MNTDFLSEFDSLVDSKNEILLIGVGSFFRKNFDNPFDVDLIVVRTSDLVEKQFIIGDKYSYDVLFVSFQALEYLLTKGSNHKWWNQTISYGQYVRGDICLYDKICSFNTVTPFCLSTSEVVNSLLSVKNYIRKIQACGNYGLTTFSYVSEILFIFYKLLAHANGLPFIFDVRDREQQVLFYLPRFYEMLFSLFGCTNVKFIADVLKREMDILINEYFSEIPLSGRLEVKRFKNDSIR